MENPHNVCGMEPQEDQGPQGIQGLQGLHGQQGLQGLQGVRGPMNQRQQRPIRAADSPTSFASRQGILPPMETTHFEIKRGMIELVQGSKFFGLPNENPLDHLDHFERVCSLTKLNGISDDGLKLRLFPFSLGDRAHWWEKSLTQGSITSWEQCKGAFLTKFFSTTRTARLRSEISNFQQWSNESFSDTWERFRSFTLQCPHHGFSKESLLSTLYRGVLPRIRVLLDTASNGYFLGKDVEDGWTLVENMAMSSGSYIDDADQDSKSTHAELEATKKEMQVLKERVAMLVQQSTRQMNFVGEYALNQQQGGGQILSSDLDIKQLLLQIQKHKLKIWLHCTTRWTLSFKLPPLRLSH